MYADSKDNTINIPTRNADNYRIYAQELFWTELCNKEFGDATDNTPYPELPEPGSNAPAPPIAKTKAVTIVSSSELGNEQIHPDWLFVPVKQGQSALCRDKKDSVSFPTCDVPDNRFILPYPAGTFHLNNVHGRNCEYKNDGKGNPGKLWCKEEDGKSMGITCLEDSGRTAKTAINCSKRGSKSKEKRVEPGLYNIVVAYCEW